MNDEWSQSSVIIVIFGEIKKPAVIQSLGAFSRSCRHGKRNETKEMKRKTRRYNLVFLPKPYLLDGKGFSNHSPVNACDVISHVFISYLMLVTIVDGGILKGTTSPYSILAI